MGWTLEDEVDASMQGTKKGLSSHRLCADIRSS